MEMGEMEVPRSVLEVELEDEEGIKNEPQAYVLCNCQTDVFAIS